MNIGTATSATEDIVARVEFDASLGRCDGLALVVRDGVCGVRAIACNAVHLRNH